MKAAPEHQLDLTRLIYAPRAKVYEAWTQEEHIAKWWLNEPFVDPVIDLDLREGGSFRFGMRPDPGDHFYASGTFQEVSEPSRIRHTWQWEGMPMDVVDEEVTLVTVEFAEKDGATELRILHTGFATEELAAKHNEGWGRCVDRLVSAVS